jgi:hypothetical protein
MAPRDILLHALGGEYDLEYELSCTSHRAEARSLPDSEQAEDRRVRTVHHQSVNCCLGAGETASEGSFNFFELGNDCVPETDGYVRQCVTCSPCLVTCFRFVFLSCPL